MSAARTFRSTPFGAPGISTLSLGIPTAAYPGRIATNSDLIVAVDRQQTTLLLPLNASATSMTVLDPSMIVAYNLLSIDNEIVKTTGPPAGNVIPISRGFDGTVAGLHQSGAVVAGMVDAYHHNVLVAEIEAIENTLGPNLSNVTAASSSFIITSAYNFAQQAPGGSLSVGTNVITLSPVPKGVNGSDFNHYLYISGGTGAAEAVLITGGTAVSGAASGTLFFTAANAHSGAWTIKSATAGIEEALIYAAVSASSAQVYISSGINLIYSKVTLPSNISLIGSGMGSCIIRVANGAVLQGAQGSANAFYNGAGGGHYTLMQLDNTTHTLIAAFTLDANSANNTWSAYGIGGVIGTSISFDLISQVEFINLPVGYSVGGGSPSGGIALYSSHDNIIDYCRLIGLTATLQLQGSSGFFSTVGYNNQFLFNYLLNMADAGLTSSFSTGDLFFGNVIDGTNGAYQGGLAAIIAENSSKTRIISNLIRNLDGYAIASAPLGGSANDTVDNLISDNVMDNCYGGIALGATSTPQMFDRRTEIKNNKIIGGARSTGTAAIVLTHSVEDAKIFGGTIAKMQGHGINIATTSGNRILIKDALIYDVGNTGTWAGIAYNPQGGASIDDLTIDNVTVRDDQTTKTCSYGILFVSFSPVPNRLILTNNKFLTLAVGGISYPGGTNLGASPENVIRNNYDGSANVWDDPLGADIVSASTITITSRYHRVTGTTAIFAIQRTTGMTDSIIYLTMVGGAAFTAGGPPGFAISMSKTTTAGQTVILRYDTTAGMWSPS